MRVSQILILCTAFLSKGKCAKSEDEGRPYEFGFTIDGEQHRYEKKDANGIIQGEFGFITADGIYHVTTYATDENGSFRILSMRNVRISDPLDGSGGTYANKVPASSVQKGGSKSQAQQQPAPLKQNQLPVNEKVTPANKVNQVIQTTTRKPIVFTTQPTIKPACAGCGYVTRAPTTQKPVLQEVDIRTLDQNRISQSPQSNQIPAAPNGDIRTGTGTFSQSDNRSGIPPTGISQRPQQPPSPFSQLQPLLETSQGNVMIPTTDDISIPQGPIQQTRVHSVSPVGPAISTLQSPSQFMQPPSVSQQSPQNVDVFNPISVTNEESDSPNFARPPINAQLEFDNTPPDTPTVPSRASDIKVENGMIFVPNNPPIQIKDKYPGMVDGLPQGIEQQDVVDLLYKFNYTVGFHGHYEKGFRNGTKIGGYFVNGRDGISRVVTYVADELGYRPKFRLINLGLNSPDTPKEDTEKTFGLKNFEFVWYPLK